MAPTSPAPQGHRRTTGVSSAVHQVRPMRLRFAFGPALAVLLVIATMSATTNATQPTVPTAAHVSFAPVTLSVVDGRVEAEAARDAVLERANVVEIPPAALEDPGTPPIPAAARRVQPTARAVVVRKVQRLRPIRYAGGSHVIRGSASWYCNDDPSRGAVSACRTGYPDTGGFDAYAAAGPRLRAAIGSGWQGRVVSVDGLRVKLVDWCQCYQGHANEKLIDLYRDVYGLVGGSVTIRW